MKDAKNHLKHVQKKVVKSAKKASPEPRHPEKVVTSAEFRRPKTLLNKRKIA